MPMSAASLHAAVQRASRARLIRFVSNCDLGRPAWKNPPEQDTDAMLRAAAFVLADRWRVVRRENRFWRAFYARSKLRRAA